MKLDLELIKKILEHAIEDEQWPVPIEEFAVKGYDRKTVQYHLHLMEEADMIVTYQHHYERLEEQVPILLVHRLTLEGHSFYANAQAENAWNLTLDIFSSIGGFSLDIVKKVLSAFVTAKATGMI